MNLQKFRIFKSLFLGWFCSFVILAQCPLMAEGPSYDPLAIPEATVPEPLDLVVKDQVRKREIPIRIYLPITKEPTPVVIFSHGLGGARYGNAFLGKHWAARGYVAVFLQHPGSDESVWKDVPVLERMSAMRKAASLENTLLRLFDVPVVIDQLDEWNRNLPSLSGRMDLKQIGMSGHSFGAVTTQAVSGQRPPRGSQFFTDSRIKAAIAFSPSCPKNGTTPEKLFGGVSIPWMLMTGTKDVSFIANTDAASRLAVFSALPPGGKYEVVLFNAEHSAFSDRALPGDREPRNPNHHRAMLALTTAFWDAYLRNDPAAKAWLDGKGPTSILEPKDRWQKK